MRTAVAHDVDDVAALGSRRLCSVGPVTRGRRSTATLTVGHGGTQDGERLVGAPMVEAVRRVWMNGAAHTDEQKAVRERRSTLASRIGQDGADSGGLTTTGKWRRPHGRDNDDGMVREREEQDLQWDPMALQRQRQPGAAATPRRRDVGSIQWREGNTTWA